MTNQEIPPVYDKAGSPPKYVELAFREGMNSGEVRTATEGDRGAATREDGGKG